MRVLIDATSVLLRSAGIKSYVYHWIKHLRNISRGADEIKAFPFLNDLGELKHEGSVLSSTETYARLALLHFLNIRGNPLINSVTGGSDVFHMSNQVRNAPKSVRLTATIHDLTCWLMPEVHTPGNVQADKSFADHVWRNANGLIAVSENTREDAIRLLGIAPEKIQVIYSGVADQYFHAEPLKRSKPYVLFVGTIEPRKNVDTLLDAWHLLKAGFRDEFDLVVAGATGWSSRRTVQRLESGIPGVHYAGYVSERDLPSLTAGATAFVYPSLYEGFGFPVAQAMACGVPVITSNNSCLPEIAGDGGIFVDAKSPVEIAAALERMLSSPDLRVKTGAAGRARAGMFRWDECARQSLAFFRSVVS
jgi:glycosyltransferase involved in cell wall biosynthesis